MGSIITQQCIQKLWEDKLQSRIAAPRCVVKYQELIHFVQLHAFGNASKRGVVLYAVVLQDQGVSQGLLTAKACLAETGPGFHPHDGKPCVQCC